MRATKLEAKHIAIKVIADLSSMKYFPAIFIVTKTKDYTNDPMMVKLVYNQAHRALRKLGFEFGASRPRVSKK